MTEYERWAERMSRAGWGIYLLESDEKAGKYMKLTRQVGSGIPAYDIVFSYALWTPDALVPAYIGSDYLAGYRMWERRRNGKADL